MSQLEQIADYWNRRAQGYSENIHQEIETGSSLFYGEKLKEYAPEKTEMSCLDIGCGPGLFSILLSQAGHQVTSVDYSPGMLEKTKANMEEAGFSADVVRSDATQLPFDDNTFDYIVSRNLVWNLEHPEKAYAEWLRVLKPGGHILVIDANHYLFYYDEKYKAAHERAREKAAEAKKRNPDLDDYGHPNMHGVDSAPIDNIARDLPLSRKLRPEWDIETFRNLGVTDMRAETRADWYRRIEADENLIGEFFVCARKHA